ncbi:MAG: GntR family transcriptional regulator [Phyllobacterium sp.]
MLDVPARRSRSAVIADALEEDIIAGRIEGGVRLDETSIAARFGVSRTPVREALHILCGRSLAEQVPYRGVIVIHISTERIDQMFEAMAEMEVICGRLSSQRMTMSERAELVEMHAYMNELAELGQYDAYDATNTKFHSLLFQGSRNNDLVAVAEILRLKLAPFRKYQLKDAGRLKRSCSEHKQIVDAILDQDARAVESALRRHLVSAAQEVITKRQQRQAKQDEV